MTLRVTTGTKLLRLPEVDRADDFPLPEGTNTLPQPLYTDGSAEDPDVFDLSDRVSLHTADDSPQTAGKRYAELERILAERDGFERVSGDEGESPNTNGGDS